MRARSVAALFAGRQPSLVFLQTCYSGAIDADALYSTAQEILCANVPAVIAMQYKIERETANDFAENVYHELFDGQKIATAVTAGRRRLATREQVEWGTRDFGTPVVFIGEDFAFVDPQRRAERPADKTAVQPQPRQCPRCGADALYRACPVCHLLFYCQNTSGKCSLPLERPEFGGFCGYCLFSFDQPPPPPGIHLLVAAAPEVERVTAPVAARLGA